MALTTCEDCGGSVSTSAAACPQCGRPNNAAAPPPVVAQPDPPKRRSVVEAGCLTVVIVVGGLVLLSVLGAVLSGDSVKPSKSYSHLRPGHVGHTRGGHWACHSYDGMDAFFTAAGDRDEATMSAMAARGECFRFKDHVQARILERPFGSNDLKVRAAGNEVWTTVTAIK